VVRSLKKCPGGWRLPGRPDDWCLTGFAEVARRHGAHALEVAAIRTLWDTHGQALFPWAAAKAEPAKPRNLKLRASG